jgi:hypothetical protein
MTKAAVIREENRKKTVRDRAAKSEEGRGSDTLTKGRYTAAREGAPPGVREILAVENTLSRIPNLKP